MLTDDRKSDCIDAILAVSSLDWFQQAVKRQWNFGTARSRTVVGVHRLTISNLAMISPRGSPAFDQERSFDLGDANGGYRLKVGLLGSELLARNRSLAGRASVHVSPSVVRWPTAVMRLPIGGLAGRFGLNCLPPAATVLKSAASSGVAVHPKEIPCDGPPLVKSLDPVVMGCALEQVQFGVGNCMVYFVCEARAGDQVLFTAGGHKGRACNRTGAGRRTLGTVSVDDPVECPRLHKSLFAGHCTGTGLRDLGAGVEGLRGVAPERDLARLQNRVQPAKVLPHQQDFKQEVVDLQAWRSQHQGRHLGGMADGEFHRNQCSHAPPPRPGNEVSEGRQAVPRGHPP